MKKIIPPFPMKLMQINRLFLALMLCFALPLKAALFYELSLEEKVRESQFIFRGSVNSIQTFKDENQKIITRYSISIDRTFKGELFSGNTIEITTHGGFLEQEGEVGDCFHYPQMNDYGIFFITRKSGRNQLYGENQGYICIDRLTGTFSDFFHHYPEGEKNWLPKLLVLCPENNRQQHAPPNGLKQVAALVNISSIQPLTATAGTGAQLTIKGLGLGANQYSGTLYFTNANDGGQTFIATPSELIVKWTDTEIISKIPAQAGTGKIRIETTSGFDVSAQILTIKAARLNTGSNNSLYESRLVKRNPNGGYLLHLNEKFSLDENASITINKALVKWRCETGVNWTIGKNSAITGTDRDTMNLISFDDKNQLPAGAIGLCYSYYKSCGSNVWFLDEFDMLFKENFNWYYGDGNPSLNQYDFFTVALHEFGHAHQLGHVIKSDDLMHYSINPAETKRDITNENSDICYEIISESVSKNTCDFSAHILIPASVCEDSKFGFFRPLIYPNPAMGQFYLELFFSDNKPVTLQLFGMNGQMVFEKQYTPDHPKRLMIDIPMKENHINAGVYVLKIFGDFEWATQKIILN